MIKVSSSRFMPRMVAFTWVESGSMCLASKSPLADFVSMHLQDAFYALSARIRDVNTIGEKMNRYIHWGTARDFVDPG